MDRIIPILVSLPFYSVFAFAITKAVSPPSELTRKEQKDFLGQHLSIVHAYAAIILSTAIYIYEGGINYNAPTNFLHLIVIGNSLGYFIFDSIYAEVYHLHDGPMRFHHVFALSGLIAIYLAEIGGSASVLGIWLSEISNPFILKRHILGAKGLENSTSYTVYENIFMFLFITMRIGWGTWYLYRVWESNVSIIYRLVSSSIHAVSLFWVFVIITKAFKKYSGSSDPVLMSIMKGLKTLRQNKALLLAIILIISFFMPVMVTRVLKLYISSFEVDGFVIV